MRTPDSGRRRGARREALPLVGALVALVLSGGAPAMRPALAASQPPIGYERWTVPNANSGVDYGQSVAQVFQKYAQPMVAPGLTPTDGTKDKRLIDIEVRVKDSVPDSGMLKLADYVFDVVWVQNEGHFALESWFVPGLSEGELHMLPQLAPQGIVAVDVERYPKGNEWVYAAILQRNAEKVGWDVLTDESLDAVLETEERRGMRVLDLDYANPGPLDCPTGQACSPVSFDAILVGNQGGHAVETDVHVNMSPAVIDQKESQGWQMIDREDGGESVVTVWVKAGQPFEVLEDLSENEVTFEHGHHGRVIDLEGAPNAFSIVRFDGSPSPASPGLADAQQGGNDDGPRAKPRDENAKGKSERDRKAKDKKGGKRGKPAKGRQRR